VHAAGCQFLEISIDKRDERLARFQWPATRCRELHEALDASPVKIDTVCLSEHRLYLNAILRSAQQARILRDARPGERGVPRGRLT